MDTSGFYKYENDTLLYGPTTVLAADFELMRENKDTYEFPIAGWYWFDANEDAKLFFNIPTPDEEVQ